MDFIELTTSNDDIIEFTESNKNIIEVITSKDAVLEFNITKTTLLIGPPGPPGEPVPGIYSGYGPPPENMHVANKSLYLDLDTFTLYQLGA